MALIVNGVTIPSSGIVTYNGVSLDKVIYNGVTVFEKVSVIREPASGEYYVYGTTHWIIANGNNYTTVKWNGAVPISGKPPPIQLSYSVSGYTYYRGTIQGNNGLGTLYSVYRIKN